MMLWLRLLIKLPIQDPPSEHTNPIGSDMQPAEEIVDTTTDDVNSKPRTNQNNATVIVSEGECLNGGTWLSWFGLCACPYTHYGRRWECVCFGSYFGSSCEYICEHGVLVNGHCTCYDGYTGLTCNECKTDYVGVTSSECGEIMRRRKPVMQSRFALSGLSLCLITIILLWISVVTRRRRTMIAANHFERLANERLLREQQRRLCERRAVAVQVIFFVVYLLFVIFSIAEFVSRTPTNHAICEFRNFISPSFYNIDTRLLNNLRAPRLNFNLTTGSARSTTAGSSNNTGNETPPPGYYY
ncbi:unnamed protein product [Anisakis simplex]|uniref:Laminin EGF-like domain-containing protein n=1 Tax=Anisakis simplex TaxID=6269 RepID=A0A0M3K4J9_ANISI|nr:unnamed protein product [Anisakis simplex]